MHTNIYIYICAAPRTFNANVLKHMQKKVGQDMDVG